MKRAERRHHRKRIIKRFHRIFATGYGWWGQDKDWLNSKKAAGRGSMGCGCCMCANPRRKRSIEGGEVTRQEKINDFNFKEQCEEKEDDMQG